MDNQFVQPARVRSAKGRQEVLKLMLVAGLSVQAWGLVAGLLLITLNLMH